MKLYKLNGVDESLRDDSWIDMIETVLETGYLSLTLKDSMEVVKEEIDDLFEDDEMEPPKIEWEAHKNGVQWSTEVYGNFYRITEISVGD